MRQSQPLQVWYLPGTKRFDLIVPIKTLLFDEVVCDLVLLVNLEELLSPAVHSLFTFLPLFVDNGLLFASLKSFMFAIAS
jgi:hypothetical protein